MDQLKLTENHVFNCVEALAAFRDVYHGCMLFQLDPEWNATLYNFKVKFTTYISTMNGLGKAVF